MEIALLNSLSLRIKGKKGAVVINPSGKAVTADGFIILGSELVELDKLEENALIIKGPGEFEFGGIKVKGLRYGKDVVYSLTIDRVEVLLGNIDVLEKEVSRLNEHHLVILRCNEDIDPSFATSLAANVILFYGAKANDTIKQFASDSYKQELKYSVTFDKLPQEIEKILLQ